MLSFTFELHKEARLKSFAIEHWPSRKLWVLLRVKKDKCGKQDILMAQCITKQSEPQTRAMQQVIRTQED